MPDDLSSDPLRGESFRLSAYITGAGLITRTRNDAAATFVSEYTISLSKILVGPPPESTSLKTEHKPSCIVVVSNLKFTVTDAAIKRECIETAGRPRFIYMHVSDPRTGLFSGTAIIEFSDENHASQLCRSGLFSSPVRLVSETEFSSLTSGDWPMLEYGPPQGVFSGQHSAQTATPSPQRPTTAPLWAQPTQRPSNPWQK
jgi:hypothetical protein